MTILEIRDLRKSYGVSTHVLRGINLQVEQGEFIGVIGLSGAGKSTLLRCINRLIDPTSGEIYLPRSLFDPQADGARIDVLKLNRRELRLLRRKVGMIFQQFNIVKRLSVIENVLSGALGYQASLKSCLKLFSREDKRRALVNLKRVGLLDHAYKRADALSGGEQQRVAVARAFVTEPKILFADEPTGNLDSATGEQVIELLFEMNRERGTTLMLVTHDEALASRCGRRIRISGGELEKFG